MTISQGVIKWLETFKPEEYWEMKGISTDVQPAKVNSYSLVKEPIVNKRTSITGTVRATAHYTLMARLDSQMDAERVDNNTWGELLEEWVAEKNKKKELPEIEGVTVQSVAVTTPFYLGESEANESVYQLTISITYVKE